MRYEVEDTGPGIAADQMARLFERSAEVRTSYGQAGAGLGLAICKAIVTACDGDIGVTTNGGGLDILV